jgi:hypothetical protein
MKISNLTALKVVIALTIGIIASTVNAANVYTSDVYLENRSSDPLKYYLVSDVALITATTPQYSIAPKTRSPLLGKIDSRGTDYSMPGLCIESFDEQQQIGSPKQWQRHDLGYYFGLIRSQQSQHPNCNAILRFVPESQQIFFIDWIDKSSS